MDGAVGPGLDPCAALLTSFELPPGGEKEIVFLLGQASTVEEVPPHRPRLPRAGAGQGGHSGSAGPLGGGAGSGAGADAGRRDGLDVESLAGLSGAELPFLGPLGVLPVERRLRLPRPASGRDGARPRGAGGDARRPAAVGVAAVPRGRRAALVAPAARRRRPHALLRRLPLAAVRRRLLRRPQRATGPSWTSGRRSSRRRRSGPNRRKIIAFPTCPANTATLYEHCVRAVEHGLTFGSHGLPLMGTGDWNDGMNKVGSGGRGESVWNGWFLLTVLHGFGELAEARGDGEPAGRWREQAEGCTRRWRSTPGTAAGIAARTSTTARRWVRRKMRNAGSTVSPNRGR